MPRPRRELVDLSATSYYHCICRCVRRAFLWGEDHVTGKNYQHRKQWVVDRLALLSRVFAIDVAAYAVMSNHYHLVLRINSQQAKRWSEGEVIARWEQLFSIPLIVNRYAQGIAVPAEVAEAKTCIEEWRNRLSDMSWFMRALNEHLARRANEEDQCTGRFWEGRFKSQALLDDAAVLTAMSYVDLNPIRAGIADLPEQSDFTSIQQRINQYKQTEKSDTDKPKLMVLTSMDTAHIHTLRYSHSDYLELVDWVGRAVRDDKRGAIPSHTPPVLERLHLDPRVFLAQVNGKSQSLFTVTTAIGNAKKLFDYAETRGRKFVRGWRVKQALYTF